jgi:small subunit ribosomal protein S17
MRIKLKNKMAQKNENKLKIECNDRLCPIHGDKKLRLRGKVFEGEVIRKTSGRVVVQFERMIKVQKYERYEKRRTKVHARLSDCMKDNVFVGDRIQISETRPISKMIHFVVSGVIRKSGELGGKK